MAGTIIVRQTGSPIRRPKKQQQTLRGLGLGRINRTRELVDTPSIRGMVAKISHMVEIVEERPAPESRAANETKQAGKNGNETA